MNTARTLTRWLVTLSLTASAPAILADPNTPLYAKPMFGPGMGPGMHGTPGYGYGMGPGMMGPGMGWGHMGMGSMGSGMGWGHMGMGSMGYGRMDYLGTLNLSDAQMEQIGNIRQELQRKHWALMQKAWEHREKLQALYLQDARDTGAIGKVYGQINDLQREMFEAHVEAEKRMEAVLTKEQREQLQRHFRGWGMMYR